MARLPFPRAGEFLAVEGKRGDASHAGSEEPCGQGPIAPRGPVSPDPCSFLSASFTRRSGSAACFSIVNIERLSALPGRNRIPTRRPGIDDHQADSPQLVLINSTRRGWPHKGRRNLAVRSREGVGGPCGRAWLRCSGRCARGSARRSAPGPLPRGRIRHR